MLSGQNRAHAIGQWVRERSDELLKQLQPPGDSLPGEATIRRALDVVDLYQLEQAPGKFNQRLAAQEAMRRGHVSGLRPESRPVAERGVSPEHPEPLEGLAMDGKQLRGANSHGEKVHLMGLATHSTAIALDQMEVEEKTNEIGSAPKPLGGKSLSGFVVTGDAMFGQKELARRIIEQGGEYFLQIKENQPRTYEAIEELLRDGSFISDTNTTNGKGHGGMENRTAWTSTALDEWLQTELGRVGVGQVVRRCCKREVIKTGKRSIEYRYAITSVTPQQAKACQMQRFWRGRRTVENKLHYARDVSTGEDSNQCHTGGTPHAMAAIRNAILALLRHDGWDNIADAPRHFQASATAALYFIGAIHSYPYSIILNIVL